MTTMIKKRVAELEGAQLDWAVAIAGEEWKMAHQHFPTMTLDPTFGGVIILECADSTAVCFLKPKNPMRQDPRPFCPSQFWGLGGPIIQREGISIEPNKGFLSRWMAVCNDGKSYAYAPTPLIAAMRCFVASKLGDEVEVPQ